MRRSLARYAAPLHDVICVCAGLVLENAALQFLVYPLLAARLGTEGYGNLQYLLAVPNVLSVSLGTALSFARLSAPQEDRRRNGVYHATLLVFALVFLPLAFLFARQGATAVPTRVAVFYALLCVLMAWRTFAEVSFKLTLRYGRFFLFYAAIGAGFAAGLPLALRFDCWPLCLVFGEAFGIAYAYLCDDTLRRDLAVFGKGDGAIIKGAAVFFLSEGLSHFIFNADRVLLRLLLSGEAVTIYYLATLVGKTTSFVTLPLSSVLMGYLSRYEGGLSRRSVWRILILALFSVLALALLCTLGGEILLYLLYPVQRAAVRPYLLPGSLASTFYFVTTVLTVVLLRFAKRWGQVAVGGVFALCFLGLGIPATRAHGLFGFVCTAVVAGAVRFFVAASLCLAVSLERREDEGRAKADQRDDSNL